MTALATPTPRETAFILTQRGCKVIPIPHGRKGPVLKNWQHLRLSEADIPNYFKGEPQNVGQLNGEPSGGVVVVDLDAREALVLASRFLPATGSKHGRPSAPASHWEYHAEPLVGTERFRDPLASVDGERNTPVEILSTRTH